MIEREPNRNRKRLLLAVCAVVGVLVVAVLGRAFVFPSKPHPPPVLTGPIDYPRELVSVEHLTVWWDRLPPGVSMGTMVSGDQSNMRPSDYVGPEKCQGCHLDSHSVNYASWSHHPHRWMNALASERTVRGDFSDATISYRGGRASFKCQSAKYVMQLERGGVRRTYEVTQTIGSRFFQYYAGRLVAGPESPDHHFYRRDHVLPFGYWLAQKEWVPVVHIGPEVADDERPDPFEPPDNGIYHADYAAGCNSCHTTFPLGDLLVRRPQQIGRHAPRQLHWALRSYLTDAHPDLVKTFADRLARPSQFGKLARDASGRNLSDGDDPLPMADWDAREHAVTLGVSCEACHLGAREHVQSGGQVRPRFFPTSPHLFVRTEHAELDLGRTHDNVNWACGRCHTGTRPAFAAGMSTWNSVEYDDAMRGSCYSKLRCVDCHNPHRAIGPTWSRPADHDDAVCLRCHDKFKPADKRRAHTHHPAGSEGARCMNCHMPRINEGIQDVVRTHMIYSPTQADMLESNQPNACNLCHTRQPIDWTLRHLKEWYGGDIDERRISANYPKRDGPAAMGWLASDKAAVRLVAVEALIRTGNRDAMPRLLDALDDPYLVNRQFAFKELKQLLGRQLNESGYRIYMTREERQAPLSDLRRRYQSPERPQQTPER
jgi:predicted CXXCH cytochrome family protein